MCQAFWACQAAKGEIDNLQRGYLGIQTRMEDMLVLWMYGREGQEKPLSMLGELALLGEIGVLRGQFDV